MLIEHRGKRPRVHETAYVAPTAVLCGDVTVGAMSRVLFGAVLSAEGGPVEVGAHCVVMEGAVVRGSRAFPVRIGDHVIVGPRAYLSGCEVGESAFLATGATVFNGAHVGARSEVRVNGVVHLKTRLAPDTTVPIGWVAVGDPAHLFPPAEHERIWSVQEPLNFPVTVFGVERAAPGETAMPEITRRYARALGAHFEDKVLDE